MNIIDLYIGIIFAWYAGLFLLAFNKKYRLISISFFAATCILFYGIKVISFIFPTNEIYQQNKRDEFSIQREISKAPIVLNITPSMWLTKIDARGPENIFSLEQRETIGNFFPLGSAPGVRTFYCAEDEGFISYMTDRFGFRNLDSVWNIKKHDIVILGDSFVESACVNTPMQDYFKNHASVVSLGKGGNGPLTSLATMKEYLNSYNANKIYHFVVSNDYSREINSSYDIDFERELLDEQLMRYLKTEFRGIQYFTNLDLTKLKNFAIVYTNSVADKNYRIYLRRELANLFSYGFLKDLITSAIKKKYEVSNTVNVKSRFSSADSLLKVYGEMRRLAKVNNAILTFVLLPDKQSSCVGDAKHKYLKKIFKNNNFETLDLWKELCHPKFFAKNGGHFNNDGYKKLAELINIDISLHRKKL